MRNRPTTPRRPRGVTVAILAALSLIAVGAAVVKAEWSDGTPPGHLASLSGPGTMPGGPSPEALPGHDALRHQDRQARNRRPPVKSAAHRTSTATPASDRTHVSIPLPPGGGSRPCAPSPHICGYPDSTNTGVPAAVALRKVPEQETSGPGWRWDPRGWIVASTRGAVISGISVDGTISVNAPDVTIKDSYINCTGGCDFNVIVRDTSTSAEANANHTVVEDSTITDTSHTSAAGIEAEDVQNTQVLRDNIYGEGAGVLFAGGSGLIEDTYIHDLAVCCGYHNEDFQSTADGSVMLQHNTLFNSAEQTADIRIGQDFGPQANVTVDNNLLAGGGWSIYGGDTGDAQAGPATNIKIINNRLSRLFYPKGGYYGWLIDFTTSPGTGNVVSGNYWDGTRKSTN
jgi:hypothetical protein